MAKMRFRGGERRQLPMVPRRGSGSFPYPPQSVLGPRKIVKGTWCFSDMASALVGIEGIVVSFHKRTLRTVSSWLGMSGAAAGAKCPSRPREQYAYFTVFP